MTFAYLKQAEFVDAVFDYYPGQSVLLCGPTGCGKTELSWKLAGSALKHNPELNFTSLQPKPADETTLRHCVELGVAIRAEYPFKKRFFESTPRGYCFWPQHIRGDADADQKMLSAKFRTCLNGEYWAGSKLVLVDDTYLVGAVYKANKDLDSYLIAGRSNQAGLISCLQIGRASCRERV